MRRVRMLVFTLVIASLFAMASMGPALAQEKVKLTYWSWGVGPWEAMYEGFQEEFPNIEITFEEYAVTDVYAKLTTAVAAGTGAPTMCAIECDRMLVYMPTGLLAPLDDEMAPYIDDFPEFLIANNSYGGHLYGIPQDVGPCGLFYRADVFDEYGFPAPRTMAHFKAQGEALKAAQAAKGINPEDLEYIYYTGFNAVDEGAHFLMMLINSLGGQLFRLEDGKYVSALDSPEALKAMKFMKEMADAGTAYTGAMWSDDWCAMNTQGLVATTLGASWYGSWALKQWLSMGEGNEGNWRIAAWPQWTLDVKTGANWGGSEVCTLTQSTEAERAAAWEFHKYCLIDNVVEAVFVQASCTPAYLPGAEDPLITASDPYFGGQAMTKLLMDEMAYIPPMEYTGYFDLFMTNAQTAAEKVLLQGVSPEEALTEAVDIINADIALRG